MYIKLKKENSPCYDCIPKLVTDPGRTITRRKVEIYVLVENSFK
jgi:hypothetical protein